MQLQRAFRGWRTRRRVVHHVREDMELLVADIRRQLDGEWTLLGPAAAAFSLDWGGDDKLRLPRMEDSLFGVSVRFLEELDDVADVTAAAASVDERAAAPSSDSDSKSESCSEQEATVGPPSPDKAIALLFDGTFENCPLTDKRDAGRVVGAQVSQGTSEVDADAAAAHGISEESVSAVEIRGTAHQAETSATDSLERQVENMDGALPPQRGKDGNPQLASAQEILATHSRTDILLELQWARQALRDRRKYLRSKRRVERGPNPYACA